MISLYCSVWAETTRFPFLKSRVNEFLLWAQEKDHALLFAGMDELASSSNEHTDSSIRSGDPRSPCEEDTARSSERHKKHRREQKDKDRTRQHLKEREESSETSSPEKRERRRKEKEGGEEDARRHRRPRDSSTSSGEGSGSVHMSLRDSRERRVCGRKLFSEGLFCGFFFC